MSYDIVLKQGNLVDPCNGRCGLFDVAISEGKVVAVEKEISSYDSKECLDCRDKTVLPGVIDPHVHISKWLGGGAGHKMMAARGVVTAIDFSGPGEEIVDNLLEMGAGLNIGWVNAVNFSFPRDTKNPSLGEIKVSLQQSMAEGALGVKILGGHYPLDPDSTRQIIREAANGSVYCAFHAGTTRTGSDLKGLMEAVELAEDSCLHIPHINSYCRGRYDAPVVEARQALTLLEQSKNIYSESYLSKATGTSGLCINGILESNVSKRCLEMGGYSHSEEDLGRSIQEGFTSVSIYAGGENQFVTGMQAYKYWRDHDTNVTISFPVNVVETMFLLATAKTSAGKFIVDAFSTDGGGIPRNSIVEHGLALVRFGALSIAEFALKSSAAPAAMFGLKDKGHLGVGADADVTVVDLERGKPVLGIAAGQVIMINGIAIGSGGLIMTTEYGKQKLSRKGVKHQVVDIAKSLGRGSHLLQTVTPV